MSFLGRFYYSIISTILLSVMAFFAMPVLAAQNICEGIFLVPSPPKLSQTSRELQPLVLAADQNIFYSDISSHGRLLFSSRGIDVFLVEGANLTDLALKELGRVREKVFRSVGEGSGLSSDTDIFDLHYNHFIALDAETHQILGAYRLGRVDWIMKVIGAQGIYSNQFFDHRALIQQKGSQMIELTRAFADLSAGSKAFRSLDSIWKGIAVFISENPQYRYVIGAVSISNNYSEFSKLLIMKFLERSENKNLKSQVIIRVPVNIYSGSDREIEATAARLKDLKDLNKAVLNRDGIGIPPLLISHAKLGAQYLGFNFDKDFNTIDGLTLVDLLNPQVAREVAKHFGKRWQKYTEHQWP